MEETRQFDRFLMYRLKLFGREIRVIDFLFVLAMLALGALGRAYLFEIRSGDYISFLHAWMEECRAAGGWAYVAIDPLSSPDSTINYGCMYQYVICFLDMFRDVLPDLYLIKLFSVIFDYVCAFTAMRIVYHVYDHDERKACAALAIVLAMPTVVMNSSAWAQADSIYTAFLLLSFCSLLRQKEVRTWLYFGIAVAFKLQALFFLPVLIIAFLLRKTRLRFIVVSVATFALSLLPACLLGRDPASILQIYTSQVGYYTQLSMNYPNIYTVVPDNIDPVMQQILIPAGMTLTMMFLGILAFLCYRKRFAVTNEYLLVLALFVMELVVFTLPVMHERYGYAAGIVAFCYGLKNPKRMGIAVMIEVLSVATYVRFLFSSTVIKLYPLAAVLLCLIFMIGTDLYRMMQIPPEVLRVKERTRRGRELADKIATAPPPVHQTVHPQTARDVHAVVPEYVRPQVPAEEPAKITLSERAKREEREERYLSPAAEAGVPRVSDIRQALAEGKPLHLKPQEGDAETAEETMYDDVPTVDSVLRPGGQAMFEDLSDDTEPFEEMSPDVTMALNADDFHAPTIEELFGAQYGADAGKET